MQPEPVKKRVCKKVLFISPTPTHPTNAGNRVHIRSLACFLKSLGYEVHFLYLAYEEYDIDAMRSFFGNRLHIVDRDKLFEKGPLIPYYSHRVKRRLSRINRWTQRKFGIIDNLQYLYNTEADVSFPQAAVASIKELICRHKFDIAICEYVFMSKALTYLDDNVFRILDTHDRFTDRFKVYLENNIQPDWISLYGSQEKKALDRANLVIAVQEKEKAYFESNSRTPVVRYSYVPDLSALPERTFEKKLLYFASNNAINLVTLNYFVDHIFPEVLHHHPDALLLVGGSLCRAYATDHPNIVLAGEFADAAEFYAMGDVVINPELRGTGFKIKTLEALAYGLPLVATRIAAAGALEPDFNHICVADEPTMLASHINRLLSDEKLRCTMSVQAKKWISQYKATLVNNLVQKLPA